jgi:hypothetical protein
MMLKLTRTRVAAAAMAVAITAGAGMATGATKPAETTFRLFPNKTVEACFAQHGKRPIAVAHMVRGRQNDTLELTVSNLKPDLDFDVFTVEVSPQLADGTPNPAFKGNFGFAWYQSDLHTNDEGEGTVHLRTILLDQIFGFDASRGVNPVNTFHLGFWFNDPADAAPCGFSGFTPFNGEHHAGPVAMITRLNAITKLGPLCTDPVRRANGRFRCNP